MIQPINIVVLETESLAAQRAADFIAEEAKKAVAARGRFVMAVSDGHASWLMLRALGTADLPWANIHIAQVDERDAPAGHPDRKLTDLRDGLLKHSPLNSEQIHAMPVDGGDLESAAVKYAATLRELAGSPPTLDLIQLCLGNDGHTASLFPGDPVLNLNDADVAPTGEHDTRRRITLTYPIINRSRQILWMITDDWKADLLKRLLDGDQTIPASRVRRDRALVIADKSVVGSLTAQLTKDGQQTVDVGKAA